MLYAPQRRGDRIAQPQQFSQVAPAFAGVGFRGANFALTCDVSGKPYLATSQNQPMRRPNKIGIGYYPGDTNVAVLGYAAFEPFPLVDEYTSVFQIFGNFYQPHRILTKGVPSVSGVQIDLLCNYSADGSAPLQIRIVHYGVAGYLLPASSFKPKNEPCTVVLTGRANDVAKCWINGVYIGSTVVGVMYPDTSSGLLYGRTESGDNKYFYGGHSLALFAPKRISDEMAKSLSANPWQIFEPQRTIELAQFVSIDPSDPPQLLVPTADVSAGLWTPSSGSDLYPMLDESVVDESDYIIASSQTYCEVKLATGVTPSVKTGHVVRYQLQSSNCGIRVSLRQGASIIVQWDHYVVTSTPFEQTLTTEQADSITNYADLRISFEVIT